jgi:hypothetical protein
MGKIRTKKYWSENLKEIYHLGHKQDHGDDNIKMDVKRQEL